MIRLPFHLAALLFLSVPSPGQEQKGLPVIENPTIREMMLRKEREGKIIDEISAILAPIPFDKERRERILLLSIAAYRKSGIVPLWNQDPLLEPETPLVRLLREHGLDPKDLRVSLEEDDVSVYSNENSIEELDLRKTLRLAEICLHLKEGSGQDVRSHWEHWTLDDQAGQGEAKRHLSELGKAFAEAIVSRGTMLEELEETFVPRNWIYQALQQQYRKLAIPGNPPQLKLKTVLNPGSPFPQARTFAEFLHEAGFLSPENLETITDVYTPPLVEAVKRLQESRNLTADGILGPKTTALLQSPSTGLDLLKLNLERARQLPNDLGRRYLLANLPSAEIFGFDDGKKSVQMRIVFGSNQEGQRTPKFRDEMRTVIFRPYWMVPQSIAVAEYLPQIRRDTSFLSRNGYEIVTFSGEIQKNTRENLRLVAEGQLYLRQKGGGDNALGRVKFLFPNPHYIYFHDTPYKSLFNSSYRAHSHGCVRLQQPEEMANWVLQEDPVWNSQSIRKALGSNDQQEVKLSYLIPVYIVYFTLFPNPASPASLIQLRDIYGHDKSPKN